MFDYVFYGVSLLFMFVIFISCIVLYLKIRQENKKIKREFAEIKELMELINARQNDMYKHLYDRYSRIFAYEVTQELNIK